MWLLLEYIEPMYRGPLRGPCIGLYIPTHLGFGGIHPLFPSYKYQTTVSLLRRLYTYFTFSLLTFASVEFPESVLLWYASKGMFHLCMVLGCVNQYYSLYSKL